MDNTINIVHVNAEIKENSVPNRLRIALRKNGLRTSILTSKTDVMSDDIYVVHNTLFTRIIRKIDYIFLKFEYYLFHYDNKGLPYSFYRTGTNILKEFVIKKADIIVLHWICGHFISPINLKQLIKRKKSIVIVCHDSWHFTGGCHVRLGCERFVEKCGKCPELDSSIMKDWSYRLLRMKSEAIKGGKIAVVSPSNWMDGNVARSALLRDFKHCVIPNPIDIDIFSMKEYKKTGRKEKYTLTFGAVNAVSTPYKGYQKLMEALDVLEEEYLGDRQVQAFIFGAKAGNERLNKKIRIKYLGYLSEGQMVELFHDTDIYVMPSLDDNLPGTVMESLACGTPVVAFNTGGIPDMICHKKNGYLAEYNNSEDLAKGIFWVMTHNESNVLGEFGREHIVNSFSENIVAGQYIELFGQLMSEEKDDDKHSASGL